MRAQRRDGFFLVPASGTLFCATLTPLRRSALPAAVALALAPGAASAAKPPQLQSMTPPRPPKTGQIKTGNAGSIMKK